ncbi:MAG: hypothetical protein MI861_26850 [Pirellulales bacterium]|nr:hypothetical protein [Pirellulales bacterium]
MLISSFDPRTENSGGTLEKAVLDSEVFQQWQTELNDFLGQTQQRLHLLSQAVALCQQRPSRPSLPAAVETNRTAETNRAAATEPVVQATGPPAEPETPGHAEQSDSPPADAAGRADDASPPPAAGPLPPPADDAPSNTHSFSEDDDALQRLSAIKARLAKQMKNTL